jgi:DDE superfamily endonuclease
LASPTKVELPEHVSPVTPAMAQKGREVRAWLDRHPRFKMHFTPTSSSWLNLVERFFADLTGDVIRAGSFASVGELARDIKAYLDERNANPKPYVWKAEGGIGLTLRGSH